MSKSNRPLTPVPLGTPTAGTLTNATGLPVTDPTPTVIPADVMAKVEANREQIEAERAKQPEPPPAAKGVLYAVALTFVDADTGYRFRFAARLHDAPHAMPKPTVAEAVLAKVRREMADAHEWRCIGWAVDGPR